MIAQRKIDWTPVREAFVTRSPRPTLEQLSTEFAVSKSGVHLCMNDEGWASLRANRLDAELARADANGIILEAVKIDRSLVRETADLCLVGLQRIKEAVGRAEELKSPQGRANCLNTLSFATVNFCKALHEMGIVGVSKTLNAAGKEDNGRWNPQMLNQINLTISDLRKAETKIEAAMRSVPPVVETPTTTAPDGVVETVA